MIEYLVPAAVRTRAAYGDELDHAPLHPEEEAAVARAVPKRRAEHAAGRACAREALAALGRPPGPIPRDNADRGAPVWPEGIVGSITHCDGYRAAAVADFGDILALGIDAEPDGPLPEGVLDVIHSTPEERAALADLTASDPQVHWDRLLFSAKETVYKAWYPHHHRMLGFEEAELLLERGPIAPAPITAGPISTGPISTGPDAPGPAAHAPGVGGTFTARVLLPGPLLADGVGPAVFTGRWIAHAGLVATAIAVPAPPRA